MKEVTLMMVRFRLYSAQKHGGLGLWWPLGEATLGSQTRFFRGVEYSPKM